jgi:hypothetical protein
LPAGVDSSRERWPLRSPGSSVGALMPFSADAASQPGLDQLLQRAGEQIGTGCGWITDQGWSRRRSVDIMCTACPRGSSCGRNSLRITHGGRPRLRTGPYFHHPKGREHTSSRTGPRTKKARP